MSESRASSHTPGFVKWGAGVVAALLVTFLVAGVILERNADPLRRPIARAASRELGRSVKIEGKLTLHLLSFEPSAVLKDVRIANPGWADRRDMARIGRLGLSISLPALMSARVVVPVLEIDDADVSLQRNTSNRANWDFGGPRSAKPSNLPVVRALRISRGHLLVDDAVRKLKFDGTLRASQDSGARTLQLDGHGGINGADFRMFAHGDPLVTADRAKPYAFELDVRAGATHLTARATLRKPFDLGSIDAALTCSGDDLADVYYLTSLALPNTAPYRLTATLKRDGTRVGVTGIEGRFGRSDIHGHITIETGGARPVMAADLTSNSLDIVDVAPSLGAPTKTARPGEGSLAKGQQQMAAAPAAKPAARPTAAAAAAPDAQPAAKASAQAASPASTAADRANGSPPGEGLLPDAQLQLQRVRGMDATVHYRAASIMAQKVPLRHVDFILRLEGGVMTLQPISLTLAQGRVSGTVRIDAKQANPDVELDARLDSIQLTQFHARNADPPAEGTLVGHIKLHGRGRSVHAAASTADGLITVAVPHGEVREAFAELTGIDVARGLGLLLTHNQQEAGIRCGVADFQARDGVLNARSIVFDTDNVLITGKGDIDLRTEKLGLSMYGQPKKFRLMRLKTPITVGGTLRKPSIGIKAGNSPGQVGVAVALGTLLTPVAAALAFIDPGLARSADCGALLDEAKDRGAPLKEAAAEPNAARTPSQ